MASSGVAQQRKDRHSFQKTLCCTQAQHGAEGRGVTASKEGADLTCSTATGEMGKAALQDI